VLAGTLTFFWSNQFQLHGQHEQQLEKNGQHKQQVRNSTSNIRRRYWISNDRIKRSELQLEINGIEDQQGSV
jgi:hypothetical protein